MKDNSTLYLLYTVELNVTGLPSKYVGIGVSIWANDRTIQSVYQYIYPNNSSFVDSIRNLLFFQTIFDSLIGFAVILCVAVAVIVAVVVLIVVLRRQNTHSSPSGSGH